MDSITQALCKDPVKTKDALINRIRFLLSADVDKKQAVILVEGPDDIKFFKRIYGEEVQCLQSRGGKKQLLEIIRSSEVADDRVIAVRDRDYSDSSKYPERMFAYDFCDLEIMILHILRLDNRLENIVN